jgi:4,5-DOPA dioxygenase extradiol
LFWAALYLPHRLNDTYAARKKMKTYFIGHGSPMNAIQKNSYSDYLSRIKSNFELPKCIIVFSAHWLTNGTFITGSNSPEQIYDFYGFPDELYKVIYSPVGMPEIAKEINSKIPEIEIDYNRGIDHAAWAVIKHIYPQQNVPVLEISLNMDISEMEHYTLGKKIADLNLNNVLFIGSGNLVHNLYDFDFNNDAIPYSWAIDINNWLVNRIQEKSIKELIEAKKYMPNYKYAAPSDDHFLPLLYVLGFHKTNIKIEFNEIQNGSISMLSLSVE